MMSLGLQPRVAEWKKQTNPLSYGGTPNARKLFELSLVLEENKLLGDKF